MTGWDAGLEGWVRARYGRAYRTAVMICGDRADAEEAVQDAFLRVWRFRDALPADNRRDAWLYRVLVNACYSKLRQTVPRHVRERPCEAMGGSVDDRPSPEMWVERSEVAAAVLAAVRELPEGLRVPVVLRYFTGLSEREIAVAIRRRPGTVKSRLHDARRRLATDPRLASYQPNAQGVSP